MYDIVFPKICLFHIVINCTKNAVVLVGKFLEKPEHLEPDPRCTDYMHSNKRGTVLKTLQLA